MMWELYTILLILTQTSLQHHLGFSPEEIERRHNNLNGDKHCDTSLQSDLFAISPWPLTFLAIITNLLL